MQQTLLAAEYPPLKPRLETSIMTNATDTHAIQVLPEVLLTIVSGGATIEIVDFGPFNLVEIDGKISEICFPDKCVHVAP